MKLLQALLFGLLVTFAVGYWDDEDMEPVGFEYDYYAGPRGPSLLELIRQTALGKEITDKVSEGADAVGRYFANVGEKLEPKMEKVGRKVEEKGEQFVMQMEPHFEKLGTVLDTQVQSFSEDVQNKSIALVRSINEELKQTADTVRVKAESFVEAFGQSLGAQLSSFWKSLTKGKD